LPPKGGHRQEINPNFITGLIAGAAEGRLVFVFIRIRIRIIIRQSPKRKIG